MKSADLSRVSRMGNLISKLSRSKLRAALFHRAQARELAPQKEKTLSALDLARRTPAPSM